MDLISSSLFEAVSVESATALHLNISKRFSDINDLMCGYCKTPLASISKIFTTNGEGVSHSITATWQFHPCLPRKKYLIHTPILHEQQVIINVRDFLLAEEARCRKNLNLTCCLNRDQLRCGVSEDQIPEDQLFIVERILAERKTDQGIFYRVRWAGYTSNHDSWEPEDALANCEDVLHTWKISPKAIRSGQIHY